MQTKRTHGGRPSILDINPVLAAEWDPERNGTLTPTAVTPGSGKKVHWRCAKNLNHRWEAVVKDRSSGSGCPYCAGRRASNENSLAVTNPALATEWDTELNGDLTPTDVTPGSRKRVWWVCPTNPKHLWDATVYSRSGGNGCPYCSGQRVSKETSLAAVNPALAAEWDPERNGDLTPVDITAGSNKKVYWRCSNNSEHRWEATVNSRSGGNGCPYCSGRRASVETSLATVNPALAAEWDPERNGDLTPTDVTSMSGKKVHWRCAKNLEHRWKSAVSDRSIGTRCPYCAGNRVSKETSLATVKPALAAEWDPERNGDLTPTDVTSGSSKKVWWICLKNPDHRWEAVVSSRSGGSGCPSCSNHYWIGRELAMFLVGISERIHELEPSEIYAIAAGHRLSPQATKRLLYGKVKKTKLDIPDDEDGGDVDSGGTVCGWEPQPSPDPPGELGIEPQPWALPDPGQPGTTDQDLHGESGAEPPPDLTPVTITVQVEKVISGAEVLRYLDREEDRQLVHYLLQGRVNEMWKLAYQDPEAVERKTRRKRSDPYKEMVRSAFRKEFDAALGLGVPKGWAFAPTGVVIEPNLMQRHVAAMMRERKWYGNWSGTGAGKTVSAVLAAMYVKAGRGHGLVVVVCPNNTIDGWTGAIAECHPDNQVATKTWEPHWANSTGPKWLILNYEKLSDQTALPAIEALLAQYRIDMLVIDEVHFAKERAHSKASSRRGALRTLRSKAAEANPKLRVLGMSATPAVNEPRETVSLLEILRGEDLPDLDTTRTTEAALRIHQEMVLTGTRWKPDYSDIGVVDTPIRIDIAHLHDDILALGKNPSALELEMVLMRGKLETVVKECLREGRTLVYTEFRTGIVEMLTDALEAVGRRVGHFTGHTKQLDQFLGYDPKTNRPVPVTEQVDVLIGTQAIGIGIDGLQHIADRLVFATLPWTSASYTQIVGRVVRQGRSKDQQVEIVTPIAYIGAEYFDGIEDWSMDQYRHNTITTKKTLLDAIVDGDLPTGTRLPSPQQVTAALLERISRLNADGAWTDPPKPTAGAALPA